MQKLSQKITPSQEQQPQQNKIVFEFYSQQNQSKVQKKFPFEILNFNIELLNNNHDEPYPIPNEIVDSEYPFDLIKEFLQAHNYQAKSFRVTKPVNSKNYEDLVDDITFKVCQQFTLIENAQKATQVVNLCRFLRFHQLHDAVIAAIATNYYVPPNYQKQLIDFKKMHKIDELSSEQICQIIKEYEDVFNMIETKSKEQFLKAQQDMNVN